MTFSSLTFLCVFLPVVFLAHSAIKNVQIKNALLVIASVVFYAYGEPVYVVILLGSAFINYALARIIASGNAKKAVLAIACAANLGVLGVFKYAGFFVENINRILPVHLPVPQIALPIGISFFTFQALSYVIDVYRGTVEVQKNPVKVLLYLSFFPQLIAGPIVKYRDICAQIEERRVTVKTATEGMGRFVCGLAKKVLIADTMALCADAVFSAQSGQINAPAAWMGALCYTLQIYFDFSGYSDMAIGMGRMFGFEIRENFNHPYCAVGIRDFWRRWHISLTSWFREYLYIPLGGNRKGSARTRVNTLIVFLCTGFWHGANWTFIAWGLYHALLMLAEDAVPVVEKLPKPLRGIATFVLVCIGFVIFRADSLLQAGRMIAKMFTGFTMSPEAAGLIAAQINPWFLFCLAAGLLGMGLIQKLCRLLPKEAVEKGEGLIRTAGYVVSAALLGVCLMRLSGSTYHPFIYFRF